MSVPEPLFTDDISQKNFEERILVLAPTGRDAFLVESVLTPSGNHCEACSDISALCQQLNLGAGAILLAEEALAASDLGEFQECLIQQEPWSDLPLLVLTSGGYSSRISLDTGELLQSSCNVTLLERPLRRETLVSAVHTALRARRRQYQTRDLLHQLKSGVRQRDEFLAMLGHELRNPLFTIRTAVELLDQVGSNEPQAVHTRAIVTRQTQHLSHLIDDLLDVARITQGKIPLKLQSIDLNEVARRCVQVIEVSGSLSEHSLLVTLDDEPVFIEGDAVRLEQILNNLLTNAVKYTPAGGSIRVAVSREDNDAVVRVSDTGLGIDPELQPRIFELFTQATRSLDRSQGGLGIGLTVTYGLVEMHHGRISVHSEGLGQGSEFEVRFPVIATPLPSTVEKVALPEQVAARRVLVVEDNADARMLMTILLRRRGFQVEAAHDGVAGVGLALSLRPEIALVDIGLPGIDGYEVARQVREELGDDIFMIALTGYGQADDQAHALSAGFNMHLTKPVEPETLYEVLRTV